MTEGSAASMERNVSEVAAVLRSLGNERRLMVLCALIEETEMTVGSLATAAGLTQSAMSQHLAKMRVERLVTFRREAQTIWYRISDARIETLIETLHALYCDRTPRGHTVRKGARRRADA